MLFTNKSAYKWVALSVTTIGSLMVAIDSTIGTNVGWSEELENLRTWLEEGKAKVWA